MVLVPLLVWLSFASAPPTTPGDALARVQTFYKTIPRVSARFEQTVTNPTFGRAETSTGALLLERPGRMRWDYAHKRKGAGTRRSFIVDGKRVGMVDHVDRKIYTRKLSDHALPVAIGFLHGRGDLAAAFHVAIDRSGAYGDARHLVLRLTPKRPSAQYTTLTLVVDPADWHVTDSIVVDAAGVTSHFRFGAVTVPAAAFDPALFRVDTRYLRAKGYQIVP